MYIARRLLVFTASFIGEVRKKKKLFEKPSFGRGPGSHFGSQTPDYWQNDAQLYFVRFSVFVESKEILKTF